LHIPGVILSLVMMFSVKTGRSADCEKQPRWFVGADGIADTAEKISIRARRVTLAAAAVAEDALADEAAAAADDAAAEDLAGAEEADVAVTAAADDALLVVDAAAADVEVRVAAGDEDESSAGATAIRATVVVSLPSKFGLYKDNRQFPPHFSVEFPRHP
jgi:hypothetical protein